MMNMSELFSRLNRQGIKLQIDANDLKINVPKSKLTPDLLKELREKKEEIINFLQNYVQTQKNFISIEITEKREYYVLSSAQNRLYVLQQMSLDSTAYNMPVIIPLWEGVHIEKLEEGFKKFIKRHDSLRTSFHMVNDTPVQVVYDEVVFEIEYYDLSTDYTDYTDNKKDIKNKEGQKGGPEVIIKSFIRPFDLSNAPLMRVGLLKTGEDSSFLLVDLHHIITDGASQEVLKQDLMRLYNGEELPSLRIQYKDFTVWQNSDAQQVIMNSQQTYWLKEYEREISLLNLPTDYERSNKPAVKGRRLAFQIEKGLVHKIKQLLSDTDTTLYMLLLAVYNILLSIYTRQQDIVVGSPITGRRHEDLQDIVGMFVNMLAMRNRPQPVKSFKEFLNEVKINSINAFENQEYPFDDLVEKLAIQRYLNRRPLVETVFTLQNTVQTADSQYSTSPGNEPYIKPYSFEFNSAKFELTLDAFEEGESILMWWTYATELFKDVTIENLKKHYMEILEQVLENIDIRLKDIKISHGLVTAGSNPWYTEQRDFSF